MNNLKKIIKQMTIPFFVVAVMWVVHLINLSYPQLELYKFGILPRTREGFLGVITSPWIHSTDSWSHIINNSIPTFVLLWLCITVYKKTAWLIATFIWLASGVWVWVAARSNFHIGMSGVIYGLAFFLFFSGIFRKNRQMMGISLLVAFLYGSLVWGLFPYDKGISFEGHIFGALAGIIMSIYLRNKGPEKDKYNLNVNPEFEKFVEDYNQALFEQEYWESKQSNSNHTQEDAFDVFFEYIKKDNENDS